MPKINDTTTSAEVYQRLSQRNLPDMVLLRTAAYAALMVCRNPIFLSWVSHLLANNYKACMELEFVNGEAASSAQAALKRLHGLLGHWTGTAQQGLLAMVSRSIQQAAQEVDFDLDELLDTAIYDSKYDPRAEREIGDLQMKHVREYAEREGLSLG